MPDTYTIQFTGQPDAATQALLDWLAARGYTATQTEILTRITVARPVIAALQAGDEGIDVSRHNFPVDFDAARNAGKRFAVIRASMGVPGGEYTGRDDRFALMRPAARVAGLLDGAYHYFVWNLDGGLQADNFHAAVGGDYGAIPPTVDVEPRTVVVNGVEQPETVDRARSTLNLIGFVNRLQYLSGKAPIIYCSPWSWSHMTTEPEWLRNYLLWVADYTPPLQLPAHAAFAWMHQYRVAEAGELAWHPGRLDLDRYTGDDPPPAPAPVHDLRDQTNQQVINLFYRVFGEAEYIGKLVTGLGAYQATLFGNRQALYTGPAVESMTLSNADQAAIVAGLGG